jgi:hypothetical protein
VPIEHRGRPISAARITRLVHELLDASSLCAIATASPEATAHVNTAYFAWNTELDAVWISDPGATHSRNLRRRPTCSIAVYDSRQSWGGPDRGIQLFGSAGEAPAAVLEEARRMYSDRFPEYSTDDVTGYRFYRFRTRRLKVFDERALGPGTFVTARRQRTGRIAWERTQVYRSAPAGDREI